MGNVPMPMVVRLKIPFYKLKKISLEKFGKLNLHLVPMYYPSRLLPQRCFKLIHWNESLRNSYLIHYTDTKDFIDPNTGKLKISLVVRHTDHLRDYSNNLLGIFLIDDIYWGSAKESPMKRYYDAEWEVGKDVDAPSFPDQFIRYEERGYFFLKVSDCHYQTVLFNDNTMVSPTCKLLHTPTNANFWHFSLRWFIDGKELENWTDGFKRRMKTSAKAFIVENAFFQEPNIEELDSSLYIN